MNLLFKISLVLLFFISIWQKAKVQCQQQYNQQDIPSTYQQSNDNQCIKGRKILTRIPKSKSAYMLKQKCLCPQNYYGFSCSYKRQIYCLLQPFQKKQLKTSIKRIILKQQISQQKQENYQIGLQFIQDCYKKADILENPVYMISKVQAPQGYVLNKNMNLKSFAQYRSNTKHTNLYNGLNIQIIPIMDMKPVGENPNYQNFSYNFIQPYKYGVQILWINDTSKFDKNGRLKLQKKYYIINQTTNQTRQQTEQQFFFREKKQLEMYEPDKIQQIFDYQYLMGFPIYNQKILYELNAIQLQNNKKGKNFKVNNLNNGALKQSSSYRRLLQDIKNENENPNLPALSDFKNKSNIPSVDSLKKRRVFSEVYNFKQKLNLTQLQINNIIRLQLQLNFLNKDTGFVQKGSIKDAQYQILLMYLQNNPEVRQKIYEKSSSSFIFSTTTIIISIICILGILIYFIWNFYKCRLEMKKSNSQNESSSLNYEKDQDDDDK